MIRLTGNKFISSLSFLVRPIDVKLLQDKHIISCHKSHDGLLLEELFRSMQIVSPILATKHELNRMMISELIKNKQTENVDWINFLILAGKVIIVMHYASTLVENFEHFRFHSYPSDIQNYLLYSIDMHTL